MAETTGHRAALLGGAVRYDVRRSERATKHRIDVGTSGITVVIPVGSSRDPEAILTDNAAWVLEKKQRYDAYRERVPDRRFEPGEAFPYLGEPHEVVVERRSASDVVEGELRLADHHVEQTSVKRALETLYRRQARERFEERADHFAEAMDVEYGKLEVRNQRTKWGSCSSSGTLGLNWRLMMAPAEVGDYVIVHEVAHLREPNHDEPFRDLVAEHDPEYGEHAAWLDEHGPRLIFSEEDH